MLGIMISRIARTLAALALSLSFAGAVMADVVETRGGARLVGNIKKIDGSRIVLGTDYAGDITIKQSEVASLQTDQARFVRLVDGRVANGVLSKTEDGRVVVSGEGEPVTAKVGQIAATWAPGAKDPAVAAREPKWRYEAAGDITGKTGNREQFGTALSARAKRTGAHDVFQIYSAFRRQTSNGTTSADQFKIGVDYSDNFSGRRSWYARDESGYDRVKRIALSSVAGSGFGYDFIKEKGQHLAGRAGLSHRYESYENKRNDTVQSFGLDLGVHHTYDFNDTRLVNEVTFVPAFDDFSSYRFMHESYFEIPLSKRVWKLRLGLTTDYNSLPGDGVKKLDTVYFTRFVFNWE
jgi:hypothetical protein